MSGTLDQNAIREAKLVTSVQRPDGEGEIKLFITSTANAPGAGPGFGYKTVKSKAQIYFYFDPQRFPQGREDPQVASALQRLIDEMPRHPEKFSNCEPINIGTPAGEEIANPDMASVEKRIETFATWPRPEMNAHKLAAAGFFYAPIPGCTDRCIFYASGNALFNWDANDDPWTEYKKWYPQCPHVRKREAAAGAGGSGSGSGSGGGGVPAYGSAKMAGSGVLTGLKSFFSSGATAKQQVGGGRSPGAAAGGASTEGREGQLTATWPAHIKDTEPSVRWRKILEWELAPSPAAGASAGTFEAGDDDAKSTASGTSATSALVDAVDGWKIKAEKDEWMREKALFVAIRKRMGEELMLLEDQTEQRRKELSEVETHLKAAMDQFFQRNAAALDQVDERVHKLADGYARVAQLISRSMETAIMQKEAGLEALSRRAQQHEEMRARAAEELQLIEDKRKHEEKELAMMRSVFQAKRLELVRTSDATAANK